MTAPELSGDWIGDVLSFWFENIDPEAWWRKDDTFDLAVKVRFAALHETVAAEPAAAAGVTAERALATIIVLDQFSRNMFRGTARAFASDAAALQVAREAIERGLDQRVDAVRRQFFYMPFEHSEAAADQLRSVELFRALGDSELSRFAEAHKAIIDRFGRFPHRNAILGRTSTAAEQEFLRQPGSSF